MFSPQLADYDGDGLVDLIAGSDCCQEACFYVFRRLKDGGFAPRQKVKPVFPPEQFGGVTTQTMRSRIAVADLNGDGKPRSEEHTSELQSLRHLVCRLLLEK